jgi:hypothetical protein
MFGEEVGVDGVFDVDHVDLVLSVADDAKTTGARAIEHSGHQMGITNAPNKMWPQCDGTKRWAVSGENLAFGEGFGQGIRARARGGERERFVGTAKRAAIVNDTRGTRVDKMRDAVLTGSCEQGARAKDVGAEKIVVATPDADFGRGVENGGDAGAGSLDSGSVVERSADKTNPTFF